jgi:mono/diheme cytochrome c family protein
MQPLPEGVVSQPNILSPSALKTPEYDKMDMEAWTSLQNPLSSTPEVLARGERMFQVYCTPCHGIPDAQGKIEHLGTVAQPGRFPGVVGLTGEAGILKARNDGSVYRTIRVGNALMPSYSWAMTDDEMWSIVNYVRTLDNGAYQPPPPPTPADEEGN